MKQKIQLFFWRWEHNLKANKISHREEAVNILDSFKNYENVERIKLASFHSKSRLNFSNVTESEVKKEYWTYLPWSQPKMVMFKPKFLKVSTQGVIMSLVDVKEITIIINGYIEKGIFPDDLKLVDVSPIFKKADSFEKENYEPDGILSHMSKVFERNLYKQIGTFINTNFSSYLWDFRKNHNAQHSLLKTIEIWKKYLDKGERYG